MARTAAWQRKEGKSKSGGLNRKGIASYRAANPGSKLSMAVTTKPSKLKKGSKAANRRKSFCSRMKGMKAKLTSARINKSQLIVTELEEKLFNKDGSLKVDPDSRIKEMKKFA
jgi:hypothetical protein